MTSVFISGPIASDPDYRAKFATASKMLTDAGCAVMNPAILPVLAHARSGHAHMQRRCWTCDYIYLLPWLDG